MSTEANGYVARNELFINRTCYYVNSPLCLLPTDSSAITDYTTTGLCPTMLIIPNSLASSTTLGQSIVLTVLRA
jgi:hypothetical protein